MTCVPLCKRGKELEQRSIYPPSDFNEAMREHWGPWWHVKRSMSEIDEMLPHEEWSSRVTSFLDQMAVLARGALQLSSNRVQSLPRVVSSSPLSPIYHEH